MKIESILNTECSRALNKEGSPIDCNLLDELNSKRYLIQQDEIRAEPDPDKQNTLKQKVGVLLISCQCKGTKGAKDIVKYTFLLGIDIDEKDNRHIPNFHSLKKEFCKIPNVAYCGLSIRGKGYFLIIPIAYPDKHELHFQWLQKYFAASGINIDPSGINVNRLRFYSHDAEAYYNHTATPLQSYCQPPAMIAKQCYQRTFQGQDKPVWQQYNEGTFFIEVLESHGWKIDSKKGNDKTYFTRPGADKLSGISAEFDSTKNIFYVFTSNGQPFEPGTGYNPFQVYTLLNHAGDFTKAALALMPNKKPYKPRQTVLKYSGSIAPAPMQKPVQLPAITPLAPIPEPTPPPVQAAPHPPAPHYALEQLKEMAWKHFNRYPMSRNKAGCKQNYFTAWSNDMSAILKQAGITNQQFLKSIL